MTDIPMPDEIIAWTKANGWGQHHLRWHIERIWDRYRPTQSPSFRNVGGRVRQFRKERRPTVSSSRRCTG